MLVTQGSCGSSSLSMNVLPAQQQNEKLPQSASSQDTESQSINHEWACLLLELVPGGSAWLFETLPHPQGRVKYCRDFSDSAVF